MSAYSAKTASNQGQDEIESEVRPDGTGLYFNNNGLFSENFLKYRLPEEKSNSFLLEHWETEALPDFSKCYEWMLSTWDEYKDIFRTLDEAQLEDKWIRPILKMLGWTYEVQDRLKKRGKVQIPDYSLFSNEKSYVQAKGAKNDNAYFQRVLAVADAKAMGVNLDGSGRSNSNPSYQIIRYMEDTGKTWGILTDGEYWRIYSLKSESKFSTFYEVNIRKALAKRDDERFKYFFNFFRKEAFVPKGTNSDSFLDVVYSSGEQYAKEVETQLRDRAFRITQTICRGFATQYRNLEESDLEEIYHHSLYYLFRLMFILNAEAKGIFDVNELSNYYPASLRRLAVDLKKDFEIGRKWSQQSKTYHYISELMDLLEKGDRSIGVVTLGKEVFSSGSREYFKKREIPDSILNAAIVDLACAYDDDGELRFIDYKRLSPDHLGSLFEGLLDYKLVAAEEKSVEDGKEIVAWRDLTEKKKFKLKDLVIEKGQLYLESGTGSKKDTGSYYTPSYIVDDIVEKVLSPLCMNKSLDEILEIKVCDPAMGSGHFLIGTIKYLEERAMDAIYNSTRDPEINREDLRWEILHNCIHGIDLNPLAVELAKFSLWIYTVRRDHELEPLADQLICADSLINEEKIKKSFAPIFKNGGFDGIVGNPPYVNTFLLERILKRIPDYKEQIKSKLSSAKGAFDICSLFVEVARKLGTSARIGYILPNKLVAIDSARGMRDFIKDDKNTFLESVDDASNIPIFKEASVYPIILILGSKRPKSVRTRKHSEKFDPSLKWNEKDFPTSAENYLADLLSITNINAFDSIELGEKFEIVSAATVDEAYKSIKPSITERESKNSARFMVSGNILGFACTWENQKVQYLKSSYEKPYLDLSSTKVNDRRKQQYQSNKIIIPNMTQMLRAFYDNGDYAPGISTTMIFGKVDELKAVAAYINSSIATEIYLSKFESLHLNGGALRVGTPQLEKLPVPRKLFDNKTREEAVQFYEKIAKIVSNLSKGEVKPTLVRKVLDRQTIKDSETANIGIRSLQKALSELDDYFTDLVRSSSKLKKASS